MYLFTNGKLFTNDDCAPFFENGAVAVSGDRIVAVGNETELANEYTDAVRIDANGGVIMPGLINLFHSSQSILNRGYSAIKRTHSTFDSTSFAVQNARTLKPATLDIILAAAYAGALESIKNGVTTVFEHVDTPNCISGSLRTVSSAFRSIGIRACICANINENASWKIQQESITENIEFADYCNSIGNVLIKPAIGFTVSDGANGDYLQMFSSLIDKRSKLHFIIENGDYINSNSIRKYRMTPIKRIAEAGLLSPNAIIAVRNLEAEEFEAVNKAGASVLPMTGSLSGKFFWNKINSSNYCLPGLGSSGCGFDMLEYARLSARRLQEMDRSFDDSDLAESMLFKANAKIASGFIGMQNGVIKAGATADIIVMNYDCYTRIDSMNVAEHITNWCTGKQCETVMIAGKLLMKNRKLLNIDEDEIKLRTKAAAESIWN